MRYPAVDRRASSGNSRLGFRPIPPLRNQRQRDDAHTNCNSGHFHLTTSTVILINRLTIDAVFRPHDRYVPRVFRELPGTTTRDGLLTLSGLVAGRRITTSIRDLR